MKIVVSSSVLLKALSSINGVIVNNPVIPILDNFLFDVEKGILSATASDLQTTVKVSLAVESDANGSIAVPAKILMETLRNLPDQPITIRVDDDTYSIEIITENGVYKLSGENAVDFPVVPPVNNAFSISAPADIILRAINYTLFATGNDDLRPAMGGVHVKLRNNGTVFASTDGHRLVKYTREDLTSNNETAILLPRKALALLKTMLPDDSTPTVINFNNQNAFFEFNQTKMICRLIDERFPDYENAIPLNNSNVLTINRLEFINTLKRISIYANKSSQQIRLKLTPTQLIATAEDIDYSNEAKESLPCEYSGEEMEIGFNARMLIETLSNMQSNMIDMTFSMPSKAALILPKTKEAEEDLLMLVMPVVLNL